MNAKQRITHPAVAEPPAGTWSNCVNIGDKTGHDVGAKASQLRLI